MKLIYSLMVKVKILYISLQIDILNNNECRWLLHFRNAFYEVIAKLCIVSNAWHELILPYQCLKDVSMYIQCFRAKTSESWWPILPKWILFTFSIDNINISLNLPFPSFQDQSFFHCFSRTFIMLPWPLQDSEIRTRTTKFSVLLW